MANEANSDEVAFDVTTSLADHAAFLRYTTNRPDRLAMQVAVYLVFALLFVCFQITLGIVTALFTAKRGLGAAVTLYLASGIRQDLSGTWPVIAGAVALLFLLNLVILTPLQCRRLAARRLATYPESASNQPTRILVSHVRLDARGAESGTRNERVFLAWPLFARLAETSRYLFLMTGGSAAIILPKRAVDAADLERVRAICQRFLVPQGSSKA